MIRRDTLKDTVGSLSLITKINATPADNQRLEMVTRLQQNVQKKVVQNIGVFTMVAIFKRDLLGVCTAIRV